MSDQDNTQKAQAGTSIVPPKIQGGKEIFDSIMKDIEPDLLSDNVDKLDSMYPNETDEQKKDRMKRYAEAFKKYEEQYKKYREQQTSDVRRFGRNVVKTVENEDSKKEGDAMANLESQISQL